MRGHTQIHLACSLTVQLYVGCNRCSLGSSILCRDISTIAALAPVAHVVQAHRNLQITIQTMSIWQVENQHSTHHIPPEVNLAVPQRNDGKQSWVRHGLHGKAGKGGSGTFEVTPDIEG